MAVTNTVDLSNNIEIDALLTGFKWDTSSITFSFPDSGWWYVLEQIKNELSIVDLVEALVAAVSNPLSGIINILQDALTGAAGDTLIVSGIALNDFGAFNDSQKVAAQFGLDLAAAVSGLTFTEVTEGDFELDVIPVLDGDGVDVGFTHGTIRFALTDSTDAPAFGVPPLPSLQVLVGEGFLGDTWYKNDGTFNTPALGNFAFFTIMHEIGHALGLKHGHESGLFGENIPTWLGDALTGVNGPELPADKNSMEFSIMTYRSALNGPNSLSAEAFGYAQSLMMLDIAALQYMYGAKFSTNSGNTTYSWDPNTGTMSINGVEQLRPGGADGTADSNRVFLTVWDGDGIDAYDLSDYSAGTNINLAPGGWSVTSSSQRVYLGDDTTGTDYFARGNIFNALLFNGDQRSMIENAMGGSGGDTIAGNFLANHLQGNGGGDSISGLGGDDSLDGGEGSDTLDGGADADTLLGGLGNDLLLGGDGDDSLEAGGGDDTVRGGAGMATINGADGNDSIESGDLADLLSGGAGNDTVSAGGGADIIAGNSGSDSVLAGGGVDVVVGGSGNDTIDGGEGNDILNGDPGDDSIAGGLGDDTIEGGDDNDTLLGEAGTDTLTGGQGNDALDGGEDADRLVAGTGDDTVASGSGSDLVLGEDGSDSVSAGAGADTVEAGAENDTVFGGSEADSILGGAGLDALFGEAGDDVIDAGGDADSVDGGDGADSIAAGDGTNTVDGGSGADTITSGADSDSIDGGDDDDSIQAGHGANTVAGGLGADTIATGSGADSINGGADTDSISAGDGADTAYGGTGADTLLMAAGADLAFGDAETDLVHGGDGADTLYGGDGDDVMFGEGGLDHLFGEEGGDTLAGGAGADTLDGGNGIDMASYIDATGPVVINLQDPTQTTGDAAGDLLISIEQFGLTNFNDLFIGLDDPLVPDVVYGRDGNDTLLGFAGADSLIGEAGDDSIIGGVGSDLVDGGAGTDTTSFLESKIGIVVDLVDASRNTGIAEGDQIISIERFHMTMQRDEFVGLAAAETIWGHHGNDSVFGNGGDDMVLGGEQHDLLSGGMGADTMLGEAGNDTLLGGDGTDSLLGGADIDDLNGGAGADTLRGGASGDRIAGGADNDHLWGDVGRDAFVYAASGWGQDWIYDFEDRLDRIEFTGLPGGPGVHAMNALAISERIGGSEIETVIRLAAGGPGEIVLIGIAATQLNHQDFLFFSA